MEHRTIAQPGVARPSSGEFKNISVDERMKAFIEGQKGNDKTFPSFQFGGDSRFFRPPVWNGASNAADGLLGCQAPAADGLDEGFAEQQPGQSPKHQSSPVVIPKPKATPNLPIHIPTEIHLKILEHSGVLDSSSSRCSFCYLSELSTLCQVSRLYYSLLQPHLYRTLKLDFTSSLDPKLSLIHCHDTRSVCASHAHLASKHQQLELRVPLLLRTLNTRPDIAQHVRRIVLPPGGTSTYLTCALEKTFLPSLIRTCPNLECVTGVSTLLQRQFFSGEHYCFDGQDPQQHGALAKTLHHKTTLRKWVWEGGNAAGRDFGNRLWDCNPLMMNIGFVRIHQNWRDLETLEVRDVWNVDAVVFREIFRVLTKLRRVALVGVRKKRIEDGDAGVMLEALRFLPMSVREVEVGNTGCEEFVRGVGEWVMERFEAGRLEFLKLTGIPISPETLAAFLFAISVSRSGIRRSLVRSLELDNDGFEEPAGDWRGWPKCIQLVGLEKLEWNIQG